MTPDWMLHDETFYRNAILDAVVRAGVYRQLQQGLTEAQLWSQGYQRTLMLPVLKCLADWQYIRKLAGGNWIWCGDPIDEVLVLRQMQARRWLYLAEALGSGTMPQPFEIVEAEQTCLAQRSDHLVNWLIDLLDPHAGERWLDVGAGPGAFGRKLAERGAQVMLYDRPEVSKTWVRAAFPLLAEFASGDIFADDIREQFHAIALVRFVENFSPPQLGHLFMRCRKLLRPGGRMVIAGYFRDAELDKALFSLQVSLHQETGRCYSAQDLGIIARSANLCPSAVHRDPTGGYGALILTVARVSQPPEDSGCKAYTPDADDDRQELLHFGMAHAQ